MLLLYADSDYSSLDCQTSWPSDLSDWLFWATGRKGRLPYKAATIELHMAKYLNSGHDIETAAQMKEAMESSRV